MKFNSPSIYELGNATEAIQSIHGAKTSPLIPEASGPDIPWSTGNAYAVDE